MLSRIASRWLRCAGLLCGAVVLLLDSARAELVRVNGVAVEMRRLTVAGAPQVAAARLMHRWQAGGAGSPVTLASVGGGMVVGRQRGPLHEAVLFRAGTAASRSEATISVTHLALGVRPVPPLPFALPWSARTLSVVESGKGEGASTEFVVLLDVPSRQTATGLPSVLRRSHWSVQSTGPWRATRGAESLLIIARALPRGTALVIQYRRGFGR